jgi:hypothetical protein
MGAPDTDAIGRTQPPEWKVVRVFHSGSATLVEIKQAVFSPTQDMPEIGQTLILKEER